MSVLVPVLNEAVHIRDTVAAMRSQEVEGSFELLFVDGGSEDGTREILEELATEDPRIRVLDNPGRRVPNGLNVGLRAARGEFVARMDAHSWYPPHYVQRGIERLRRGDVDWVAGPAIPRPGGRWSRRVALALGSRLGQGGSSKWRGASDGDVGSEEFDLDTGVFAGVWRRSTLERYDGWDEGWPVNQDAELAARFLEDGRRIVCLPELGAEYAPRETLRGLWRQYWRFGYYRVKTVSRHPGALRRSHLLPVALVLTVVAGVVGPRAVARPARAVTGLYLAVLLGLSADEFRASTWRDRLALPVVFATMHLGWGAGFVGACLRLGVPLQALWRAATGRTLGR